MERYYPKPSINMLHRDNFPVLNFPEIDIGSHGTEWDLKAWLYRGGAGIKRNLVNDHIQKGDLGIPLLERLDLVDKLHERLKTLLVMGRSHHYIKALINNIASFLSWVEIYGSIKIKLNNVELLFLEWAEHLWDRVNIKKDLKRNVAFEVASRVASVLIYALEIKFDERVSCNNSLIGKTRLRRGKSSSSKSDRSNLADVASFGNFLVSLCNLLTTESIRGPLPFIIRLPNGRERHWPARMKKDLKGTSARYKAQLLKQREPLKPNQQLDVNNHRAAIANLRIEAELAIFIAQTGMNAQQAMHLGCSKVRWKLDGDDAMAFKVYKNRRHGEALFRAFKEYRHWLKNYLDWRDKNFPNDDRLFPFYSQSIVPPKDKQRYSQALKNICKEAGVPYINSRNLRKTRQNWLLRLSGNSELSAMMGAHTKEILIRDYEEVHHQSASARISQFHSEYDPSLSAGPGLCASPDHIPVSEPDVYSNIHIPDCISPEGCLFCIYHRDILDSDYPWKLASHSYLKKLERDDYEHPIKKQSEPHPADLVIDRIEDKLSAFSERSKECATWVEEAKIRIWEGRYHPAWKGFIELWEHLK